MRSGQSKSIVLFGRFHQTRFESNKLKQLIKKLSLDSTGKPAHNKLSIPDADTGLGGGGHGGEGGTPFFCNHLFFWQSF